MSQPFQVAHVFGPNNRLSLQQDTNWSFKDSPLRVAETLHSLFAAGLSSSMPRTKRMKGMAQCDPDSTEQSGPQLVKVAQLCNSRGLEMSLLNLSKCPDSELFSQMMHHGTFWLQHLAARGGSPRPLKSARYTTCQKTRILTVGLNVQMQWGVWHSHTVNSHRDRGQHSHTVKGIAQPPSQVWNTATEIRMLHSHKVKSDVQPQGEGLTQPHSERGCTVTQTGVVHSHRERG
ncbi:hypothetical protein BKA83DRAFT_4127800 [Pisolithus microcarpus]|nr:hypothetical protein BKA83DRAFT_4127800 [Pisolithus microcarpus]